ncbi:hypothetical protein CEXT_97421 [Caerostris extrusa]|uniref:Uncharacterized protein n=1 Tax=Caerostris extrusa TaxID=172846 RepID=A0AAV4QAR7_CAEEX|nr:hypothetical protein CEXT_97421 [Caerostris extrusa]
MHGYCSGHPHHYISEITETVVDISIRSALHYLQYKEILMAADDILKQSIPAELHTACLTFGQLKSLREHSRTFIAWAWIRLHGCVRRPRLQGDRSHNSSKILSIGQRTDLFTGVFSRMEYYNSVKI